MTEIILFFLGLIVGAMNSIAGGGMLLGFPVMFALGMNPLAANVTANVVLLPGQLSAVAGYRRFLRKMPARYLILLLPCMVGAAIGSTILRHVSSHQFADLIPALIILAVLLFAVQPYLHFHLHRHIAQRSRKLKPLWLIGLALLPMTIYAGFFGAGFGFILLAFLSFANMSNVHRMNALKNAVGASITTVNIAVLFSTHLINWPLGLSMAAGNVIGAYNGARFSQRFSSHVIRLVVIAVGLTGALYLGLHNY